MIITAKLTKLTCFVNTVLQPCLILDKLFIFVAYDLSASLILMWSSWRCRPRALDTFQH